MRGTIDFTGLNPRQLEAVFHDEGPLLVLAGAGSGKTRVITYRIGRLLGAGVAPDKILGVTFTNKAAREMQHRLHHLVGKTARRVHLSTFHALGLTILRDEHKALGLREGFCIYDTSDQLSLIRELMRQTKVADRRLDAGRVLELILKTKRLGKAEVDIDWGDDYEFAAFDLYPKYIEQMRAFNAVDFDDLLLQALRVLRMPEVRERWHRRFSYLLVDEYQDTSPEQLELVQILAGPKQNVCVVGDDDQSIYAWRGAAVSNILSFGRTFAGTNEVILDQNYRSTGHILAAANTVIRNNKVRKEKVLWSASGMGDPVHIVQCNDGDDEATFVAEIMQQLIYEGAKPSDIAVLYRTNTQSRVFEETLAMERIPYRVVGGQAFFERKEVRDALAFLSVAYNPLDEVALRRIINVPPRGIGPTSLERLAEFGESNTIGLWGALQVASHVPNLPKAAVHGAADLVALMQPASEGLRSANKGEFSSTARTFFENLKLRETILQDDDAPSIVTRRLDNLEEVLSALSRFADDSERPSRDPLGDFLRFSSLVRGPADDDAEAPNEVTLMTLHSAKGLEFPYVFMVGMEEELLPHKKTMEEGGDLTEERRLCYVGITRARRRLWLTLARMRKKHGKLVEVTPSRFLQELPGDEGVKRVERGAAQPVTEDMGNDFFKKMREQLGIT